ncbi:MAG: KOW motif-containing protein [Candidatus Micrarchaeota archaeon]
MALIEPGRVCVIIKGADAGKEAVIKDVIDKNFVTIAGAGVKERRSNIKHLEMTGRTSAVQAGKAVKQKEKKPQQSVASKAAAPKAKPAKAEKK